MKIVHTDYNVPYLPLPNRVDVILSDQEVDPALAKTSFLIPLFEDGDVLLSVHQRRGIEISGGHIEPGETMRVAAKREGFEETGAHVNTLVPIGYLRMSSEGTVPADWKYPHPLSYQQFYAGMVDELVEYTPNEECAAPLRVSNLDGPYRRRTIKLFGEEARRILLDKASPTG